LPLEGDVASQKKYLALLADVAEKRWALPGQALRDVVIVFPPAAEQAIGWLLRAAARSHEESPRIQALYDKHRDAPFPALGKTIGAFGLYDSLLAGCAHRAVGGEPLPESGIPVPDAETTRAVERLRGKSGLSQEEAAFLSYFDLTEQLRIAITHWYFR
jgi:hypothetical protein